MGGLDGGWGGIEEGVCEWRRRQVQVASAARPVTLSCDNTSSGEYTPTHHPPTHFLRPTVLRSDYQPVVGTWRAPQKNIYLHSLNPVAVVSDLSSQKPYL